VNFAADRILVDYILFCTLDVDLDINPNEVSDARYVSKAELEGMFADDCEWRRFPNLRSFLFAGNHATRRVVELVKTA
jgi:isopentenyldiphosphate isomerase